MKKWIAGILTFAVMISTAVYASGATGIGTASGAASKQTQAAPLRLTSKQETKVGIGKLQLKTTQTTAPVEEPSELYGGPKQEQAGKKEVSEHAELKAVWVSYLEFASLCKGNFAANVQTMLDNAKDFGLNAVVVQVRPFSDALYQSDIYPWSHVLTGTQGKDPGYDPLAIFIEQAHARDMEVHAWINPYRVRNTSKIELSSDNPAAAMLKSGSDLVLASGDGLYYNPARAEVIDMVVDGVVEIVRKYDVDGIHFDDYFYPTTDASFDAKAYKELGGSQSLADFRRANVDKLVKKTYAAIKAIDSDVVFGISPAANIDNNINQLYSNVRKWGSEKGYVDYLCPQIYFGFDHASAPYIKLADDWNSLCSSSSVKLYIGLAPYKSGYQEAAYAKGGVNEWVNNDDILARQVKYARNLRKYGGFMLYRYDSLFAPASKVQKVVTGERENLQNLLMQD